MGRVGGGLMAVGEEEKGGVDGWGRGGEGGGLMAGERWRRGLMAGGEVEKGVDRWGRGG